VLADENLLEDDVFWALSDHLGTVRRLVDNAGNAIRDRVFSAWGQVVEDTNPTFAYPFAFTGREYDRETGLYYYRARYYDPHTGRFLSEDPLSFAAGDTNLSRYVFNSPPNYTDPTGEFIQVLVGAGIGAVVGGVVGGLTGADGWDWDRFWAGAASGALIGSGVGVFFVGLGATGLAATALSAVGGGLLGAGSFGAFGGAMRWGQRGVDWTLWLQHTYWGAVLGAVAGATGGGTMAGTASFAPKFVATWYGGMLTTGAAGGLADLSVQMTALAFGLQQTYRPLQTLAVAGASTLLSGAFLGGVALWTRFRTTRLPNLAPGTTSATPIGRVAHRRSIRLARLIVVTRCTSASVSGCGTCIMTRYSGSERCPVNGELTWRSLMPAPKCRPLSNGPRSSLASHGKRECSRSNWRGGA
jgi:RHS repeat-associated protein